MSEKFKKKLSSTLNALMTEVMFFINVDFIKAKLTNFLLFLEASDPFNISFLSYPGYEDFYSQYEKTREEGRALSNSPWEVRQRTKTLLTCQTKI